MGGILTLCRGPLLAALLASFPALGAALTPVEGLPMLIYAPFADARLVRAMPRNDLLLVSSPAPGLSTRLYAAGATLVISSRQLQGCAP